MALVCTQITDILATIDTLDGRYYLVFTDFELVKDKEDKVIGYKASRKKISKHVTDFLDSIYNKLVAIKKRRGMVASGKYLTDFLRST